MLKDITYIKISSKSRLLLKIIKMSHIIKFDLSQCMISDKILLYLFFLFDVNRLSFMHNNRN